jgi:hypothetical protein
MGFDRGSRVESKRGVLINVILHWDMGQFRIHIGQCKRLVGIVLYLLTYGY